MGEKIKGKDKVGGQSKIKERAVGKRILFWNVAGIKNKDAGFWNYMKEFEVVGLTEAWLEETEETKREGQKEE